MKSYTVSWEISVSADSPEDAAEQAAERMREEEHSMLFFEIQDDLTKMQYCVDLNDPPDTQAYCMTKESI